MSPAISPFTNLTNNLSLQQQYSVTGPLNEITRHEAVKYYSFIIKCASYLS